LSEKKWGKRRKDGQVYIKGPAPIGGIGPNFDIVGPPSLRTESQIKLESYWSREMELRGTQVRQAQYNLEQARMHVLKVMQVLPSFEKTVHKEGFEVSDIRVAKTGMGSNWEEGDHMRVSATLVPVSNKVKFVPDRGYASSGAGRNKKQLEAKATKLSEAIEKGTGLDAVSVNPFSFEEADPGKKNRVLIDFWVKANEVG